MIKKISILFVLIFSLTVASFAADQQISVKLYDDKQPSDTTIRVDDNISIRVKGEKLSNVEKVRATVTLGNEFDDKWLLLFIGKYDKKNLKNLNPKVKFNELFPADSTVGNGTLGCNRYIEPKVNEQMCTVDVKVGEKKEFELPIYVSEYKEKKYLFGLWKTKELIIREKKIVTLKFEIESKPKDDEKKKLNDFKAACDSLINELDTVWFCNNPKHKPSLEEQKKKYEGKIKELSNKIHNNRKNLYFSSDSIGKEHTKLLEKLDSIQFNERDCGKHAYANLHRCEYCSLSLEKIYENLDDIYLEIYNGKAKKEDYMKIVEAMYKCAQIHGNWKKSEYKELIKDVYKYIKEH